MRKRRHLAGGPTVLGAVAGSDAAQQAMSEVGNATTGSDVLQRLTSGIRQNSEPTYALVGVALNSLREDPVITEAYNNAVAEYRGRVAHAVDRIGALGELRDGLNRHDATDILWFFLGVNAWRVLIDQGWSCLEPSTSSANKPQPQCSGPARRQVGTAPQNAIVQAPLAQLPCDHHIARLTTLDQHDHRRCYAAATMDNR